jgi:RNA polymerase sigma-70 factor, ECF subfamily
MTADAHTATLLVDRARAGDREAFNELVRRYRSRIVALALHLTGSDSEAEDIAQEVFLKAFQKLADFEGRSHFFTWVYRMAVNRSLNARRDRKRRRETEIDDPRVSRAIEVDAGGDPERAAVLRESYGRLVMALDRLPAPMRTTVVLVVLQGLGHAEAAVVQGCSVGTIAWRIHEARGRLREAMAAAENRHRLRKPRLAPVSSEVSRALRDWLLPVPRYS